MSYRKAINWNVFLINIKTYDKHKLKSKFKPKSVSEWIRYHRQLNQWSQMELALRLGFKETTARNIIKDYEIGKSYPSIEVSKKLAKIFKINKTYFYDDYYEYTNDNFKNLIIEYRKKNNLTKTRLAKKIGTSYYMISRWECGFNISRKYYLKLKELGI